MAKHTTRMTPMTAIEAEEVMTTPVEETTIHLGDETGLTNEELNAPVNETVNPSEPTEVKVEAPVVATASAPATEIKWPEYDKEAYAKLTNISQKIRFLGKPKTEGGMGWSRGTVSKFLSAERGRKVLYQHVRNVLITPVKRAS